MTILEMIKTILGMELFDSSRNSILSFYQTRAEQNITNYCGLLPEGIEEVIAEYAAHLYRNRDSIGLVKRTEGELGAQYSDGIPDSVREALPPPKIRVGVMNV